MKTICVARLRERAKYIRPMEHILDCFYDPLREYMAKQKQYKYTFYNISFDGTSPRRDVQAIRAARIIIIPSEHEFHYYTPNYFHQLDLAKNMAHLDEIRPFVEGKTVVLLRFDRGDTEELYRTHTFKGVNYQHKSIDEIDFPGGIHALKFYFIRDYMESMPFFANPVKEVDFCYWGTLKNKSPDGMNYADDRHVVLKQISKTDLRCCWIGRFHNIKRDHSSMSMADLVPVVSQARATLCFNWLDATAITARYNEAIAMGVIPFVWNDYDKHNTLNMRSWQRVHTVEEFVDKVRYLRTEKMFAELFGEVAKSHKILPRQEYYKLFDKKLNKILEAV